MDVRVTIHRSKIVWKSPAVHRMDTMMSIGALCVHRDIIYCGLGNGAIISIDPANVARQKVYRGIHRGFITSIAVVGDSLFTASQDGTIQLWDVNTAEPKHTCKWHTKAVRVLHLCTDLGSLFSAGADRMLFRLGLCNPVRINDRVVHRMAVLPSVAYCLTSFKTSAKSTALCCGLSSGQILVLAGNSKAAYDGHTTPVMALAPIPAPSGNGGLFSASRDGCVRHWVSRGAVLECRSTYQMSNSVYCLRAVVDKAAIAFLAGGSSNHIVRMFTRTSSSTGASKAGDGVVGCGGVEAGGGGSEERGGSRTYVGHEGTVLAMAVLPSTGELISASANGCVRRWTPAWTTEFGATPPPATTKTTTTTAKAAVAPSKPKKKIEENETECFFPGCRKKFPLAMLATHLKECDYRVLTCTYPSCGQQLPAILMQKHVHDHKKPKSAPHQPHTPLLESSAAPEAAAETDLEREHPVGADDLLDTQTKHKKDRRRKGRGRRTIATAAKNILKRERDRRVSGRLNYTCS